MATSTAAAGGLVAENHDVRWTCRRPEPPPPIVPPAEPHPYQLAQADRRRVDGARSLRQDRGLSSLYESRTQLILIRSRQAWSNPVRAKLSRRGHRFCGSSGGSENALVR